MNLSPIAGFFSSKAIPLLAGALALSAAGNIAQFYYGGHQAEKKVECQSAVTQTVKNAEKDKAIVEVRQRKAVNESNDRISNRIADATRGLQDSRRRVSHPSVAPEASGGATGEGGATVVLPAEQYSNDKRICITNTLKAEGWQEFYDSITTIREEQNGHDSRPD